jgi:hypothetical protein
MKVVTSSVTGFLPACAATTRRAFESALLLARVVVRIFLCVGMVAFVVFVINAAIVVFLGLWGYASAREKFVNLRKG